jgi:pimeloyl-ACP methyl ester carboxylesterase
MHKDLKLITFLSIVIGLAALYLLVTLFLSYLVQHIPRNPVEDKPNWGTIIDTKIPSVDGGFLEVWRIEPETSSCGIIVFAHGWGRNRDRMVHRARIFAKWGFTTVIHSARDHGNSSASRLVSAMTFAEDIEAVLQWIGEPVLLYGHSAGAAGAIIAAGRNHHSIQALFLEASYADTKEGLRSLYQWANRFFGIVFAPMIIYWWDLFFRGAMDRVSPKRLAAEMRIPVMIIHGEKDQRFPLSFALQLKESFPGDCVDMFIAKDADHSDSSHTPGYQEAIRSFLDRCGAA